MFNPRPKDRDKPKPENLIPVQQYRVNYLSKTKKKNKFNAVKQTYNGNKYDSKLESSVAQDLDFRKLSGELTEIKRQVKIPIYVNGVFICNYYLDFKTVDKYGQINYIEVKGFATPLWIIKKKLFIALLQTIDPGATYEIIMK